MTKKKKKCSLTLQKSRNKTDKWFLISTSPCILLVSIQVTELLLQSAKVKGKQTLSQV